MPQVLVPDWIYLIISDKDKRDWFDDPDKIVIICDKIYKNKTYPYED